MRLAAPALSCVILLAAFEAGAEPPVPAKGDTVVDVPGKEPRVLVELRGPEGAAFMRENTAGWGSVCHAPCRARVPRGEQYKVLVPGWRPTYAFDFSDSASASAVRLDLARASEAKSIIGQSLGWLGIAALVGGLITVAVVDSKAGDTAGLVIAGGGALSLGIGIPLAISGAHSSATPTPIAPTARLFAVRGAF